MVWGCALVIALAATMSACSDGEEPVARPSGSVQLVQNRPMWVGDQQVVASDLRSDSASITVLGTSADDPAQGERIEVGASATIAGLSIEVIFVELAQDRDGPPGSNTSSVWILPG